MPNASNEWLPEPLASKVKFEEPERFRHLIDALAAAWGAAKAAGSSEEAPGVTLPYIPLIKVRRYTVQYTVQYHEIPHTVQYTV
jgi:hypothetical protein